MRKIFRISPIQVLPLYEIHFDSSKSQKGVTRRARGALNIRLYDSTPRPRVCKRQARNYICVSIENNSSL